MAEIVINIPDKVYGKITSVGLWRIPDEMQEIVSQAINSGKNPNKLRDSALDDVLTIIDSDAVCGRLNAINLMTKIKALKSGAQK